MERVGELTEVRVAVIGGQVVGGRVEEFDLTEGGSANEFIVAHVPGRGKQSAIHLADFSSRCSLYNVLRSLAFAGFGR